MPLRLNFMLLGLLIFPPSIVEARVHRRSVGPVILDLGTLPPAPLPPGALQSPARREDVPSPPQPVAPPDVSKSGSESVLETPLYPAHAQSLGALILTINSQVEQPVEVQPALRSTLSTTDAPALVAHYHPTLAEDYALLRPPVETLLTIPPPNAEPKTETRADAQANPPLSRLRVMVIWIGRLLFLSGLGALILLLRRRRLQAANQAVNLPAPLTPSGVTPEAGSPLDVDRSLALRGSVASPGSATDSLSLMTGKPMAMDRPESESRVFGLIEPGAERPATPRVDKLSDQGRQGRRSP